MNISKGIKAPAGLRAVIYGVEGIGKTTLAAQMERPLFMDLENGSFGLDVARIEGMEPTFTGVLGAIESLRRDHGGFATLAVDSADKLEDLIVRDYLREKNAQTLVGYGKYGDGWIETAERFCTVLDRLGDLADSGMDVVLVGHAIQRRVDLPEQTDSYDHWELNLSKRAAPRTREWPEILAFVNYKMAVIPSTRDFGKVVNKAEGGRRMVHTAHTPYWDAKHRAGIEMPDEFPLDEAAGILRAVFKRAADEPAPRRTERQEAHRASSQNLNGGAAREPEKAAQKAEPVQRTGGAPRAPRREEPAPPRKEAKSPLRKALDDFGISDDEIREYIRSKRVCGDAEPWQVDDIPAKFAEWLVAKMPAIAQKIKGDGWVPPF